MDAQAIEQGIINAGDRLAEAKATAARLANGRSVAKWEAMQRLVQSGAVSSLTAAEKFARLDTEYADYCERQVVAEAAEVKARAYLECVTARARMAASTAEVLA